MGKHIFLVLHDEDSYEAHPDLIGFHVKTDLNGEPIRDKRGKLIPENPLVSECMHASSCVFERFCSYLYP